MMLNLGSFSFIFLFCSGLISYVLMNKHLLLMLISLESMVLSIYMLLFYYYVQFNNESFVNMIYLTMSVCEGALGLALLVTLIRTHGKDLILAFDNLW
uniref:NADH-ubiquinone oxidoreductase chain 4L n=1 Tax=Scolytinae sp. BMNH 1274713 TaxID=1796544 RepID=A0A126TGD3_9CUCU|nr:NADH dehydrogenase subunit 4L [Scolytinae sp. BMNH 1274713]